MDSLTNRTKGLLGAIGNVTIGIAAALALLVKYAPMLLAACFPTPPSPTAATRSPRPLAEIDRRVRLDALVSLEESQ